MALPQDPKLDALFDAILSLKNKDECYAFFDDVCTIKEVNDVADRLEVARLLLQGLTYELIEKQTGMSSATISRVNRCIQYGPGGYKLAVARQKKIKK
jgi:TrpR-related protein YerC/YecD